MPHLTVKQLPHFIQPREKLELHGPSQLSTPELLAIILGSGTTTENALTLAKKITRRFLSLSELSTASLDQLIKLKGVGKVKAGQIIAGFELGRRIQTTQTRRQLLSPQQVLPLVEDIRSAQREHLVVLYLNGRHELLVSRTVAIGSLNQAIVEPRDVLSEALKLPCPAFILIHNHPSGDANPSDEDVKLTVRLIAAGELLGLELIDHITVTQDDYRSMKQLGLI